MRWLFRKQDSQDAVRESDQGQKRKILELSTARDAIARGKVSQQEKKR